MERHEALLCTVGFRGGPRVHTVQATRLVVAKLKLSLLADTAQHATLQNGGHVLETSFLQGPFHHGHMCRGADLYSRQSQ